MAFVYDVAEVKDMGTYYNVNYVTNSNLVYLYPGKSYVKLSHSAANEIRGHLQKGYVVSFSKGIQREILPGDIVSTELREFEREKALASFQVGQMMDSYLATLSLIELFMHSFNFTTINNKLGSKGYFITEENREQMYLAIINTEDDSLISELEKYLEALDNLNLVSSIYKKYTAFKDKLSQADSLAEIRELTDQTITSLTDSK